MLARAVTATRSGGIVHRFWRDVRGRSVHLSVPLTAAYSSESVDRFVERVARKVDRPARSARVTATALALHVKPARFGVAVKKRVLARELEQRILDLHAARTFALPTRVVKPAVTNATLPRRYPAFITVDRETYQLRLFRHLKLYKTYPIAVGRQGLETPAGLYRINDREVNPSWHVPKSPWAGALAGRVIPPGPDDPIKARWLGFYNGAGIHGTEDVGSIGTSASHGCIRMLIPDVEELYNLVPYGTPIYVG
jgi:lipoprotein-anchoring transpeptidase ErfK/SrfK